MSSFVCCNGLVYDLVSPLPVLIRKRISDRDEQTSVCPLSFQVAIRFIASKT